MSGGSSEVYEVDRGLLIVLARFDQASSLDFRTHARKMQTQNARLRIAHFNLTR